MMMAIASSATGTDARPEVKSVARKICLLGDSSVGKASAVARYVRNTFSDTYLTTVGVRIDAKRIEMDDHRGLRLAQSHAISSIKRSTFHLPALSLACTSRLPEVATGRDSWEPVNVDELLAQIGGQIGKVTLFDSRIDREVKADGVPDTACLPYEEVRLVRCCKASCVLDRCDGMAKFAASAVGSEIEGAPAI